VEKMVVGLVIMSAGDEQEDISNEKLGEEEEEKSGTEKQDRKVEKRMGWKGKKESRSSGRPERHLVFVCSLPSWRS
jgi:hypothetical protein